MAAPPVAPQLHRMSSVPFGLPRAIRRVPQAVLATCVAILFVLAALWLSARGTIVGVVMADVEPKRTLWSFRAEGYKHRETVFLLQQCIVSDASIGAPPAFWYTAGLTTFKSFGSNVHAWVEWYFVYWFFPQVGIAANVLLFFSIHPWLVAVILVHLCAGQFEHSRQRWLTAMVQYQEQRSIGKGAVQSLGSAIFTDVMQTLASRLIFRYLGLAFTRLVFFVIPWPLIDLEMYIQLYIVPIILIIKYCAVGPAVLPNNSLPLRGGAGLFRYATERFAARAAAATSGRPASLLRTPSSNPSSWPNDIEIPEALLVAPGDDDVPRSMRCPITMSIMKNPTLVTTSGRTYENEDIRTHHLNSPNAVDPMTRVPFRVPEDLVANFAMRDSINEFIAKWKLEQHPDARGSGMV